MYEIRYAYPSSDMAKQLRRVATGCYYVLLDGFCTNDPFATLDDAIKFAESTGHTKGAWSM